MQWTKHNSRRLSGCLLALAAVCVLVLTTSCSSRAYVIARQNAGHQLSISNKIVIADHAQPAPEEQFLRATLMSELRRQGFNLVAASEAEYTLTYWIDASWKRGKVVIPARGSSTWVDPNRPTTFPSPPSMPRVQTPEFYSDSGLGIQHVVEVPWETKGIRLKVFSQESMRAGNMQTAWDGYIEAGEKVSEKHETTLVRTLLHYFGTDFTGKAKLVALPPQSQ